METLFDPADVAALRPHVERIPMSPHCAAAINSVKAAQPREPTPLSNLEYLPPLPDRRPSSTASLTEAIARILQIDPSSVATSPGRTVVTQSRPAPAGSSQLHEQAQPTPSGAGPAQVDDAPALSSLYRPTVSSGGAASTAARSAWRSVPQVRTPRPTLMQRESGSTAGGTGASGAVGLRAAHARRGADSKVQRVNPPAGSVNKSGAHVGRKALWKGRAGRAHYGAHHQGAEVRRERDQLDSRTFKITSTMQTVRPTVKTATQIAQLTARLRLRHGCKPRTIQNPVSNDCTQWSLPHIDRSPAYGHPQPEPSCRDREVPVSALAPPASVPTLSLERQQDRRERK
ncbi:uncharacterized protein LOC113206872 isoform X1 [Frankliniella occidentalis]|uniref:Uncharacterized protein LOC113206872 isoform X1 n=1 Tax=Frankliniella occidentalis TaxID=133901 RepID=A0A9C6UBJ5_FRAOC|nr:uncharacterized protein LOC113206872 isoform X1 [Frankliniella occidentalis]